jgi:photosystem II stability/assembly factor-like uncharacterized protein
MKSPACKLLNVLVLIVVVGLAPRVFAQQWTPLGPDGGNVRSLAYDPQNPDRIFLGTSSGQLFLSNDNGVSWSRLAHFGTDDDYVLDHVIVHPRNSATLFVAAWSVNGQVEGGDVFRSDDGGNTWRALPGMHNKSVRALSLSASDPDVLVAGALDGVYRTSDGGASWSKISPERHAEIKNIESVAVDPRSPNVVYAGTWHLAWKTDDAGANWRPIRKGMIDDSDVFSILVDRDNSSVVYASACSGIYKSEAAGELFHKVQGIPFEARRTRVLHQDPSNPAVVYAGTTEGLWRTQDAGKTWKRVSDPSVTVNDVLVDPRRPQRILLATDRGGVLASNDGGATFVASNQGFAHRQVQALLTDRRDPATLYAGLVSDREFGGVFISHDAGRHWQQRSVGLGGRDVYALAQAANGALLAGTNGGIFLLEPDAREWRPINNVVAETTTTKLVRVSSKSKKKKTVTSRVVRRSELKARVNDLQVVGDKWIAATSEGIFSSTDGGKMWRGGPVLGQSLIISARTRGDFVAAATPFAIAVSSNGGETWTRSAMPSYVSRVYGIAIAPEGELWAVTREGALHSSDQGVTWDHVLSGLPARNLGGVMYDEQGNRLLITALGSGEVFASSDLGHSWQRAANSGYPTRTIASARGRLFAATAFDGVVAQPGGQAERSTSRADTGHTGPSLR